MDFREFIEQKPWKAKRKDIIQMLRSLRPNQPIQIQPVDNNEIGKKTRYDDDGIRLTGSAQFITSVLSRLKDVVAYETNPTYKLDVRYQQIEDKTGNPMHEPKYVFYLHLIDKNKEKSSSNSKQITL